MAEEPFEIIEPKDYTSSKDEAYSHSMLVMNALKECGKARSKEMRDGYFNVKFDVRGNAHNVWIEDSREIFISTVETLMMIQERDYDLETQEQIYYIEEWLDKKYKKYVELEKQEWGLMDYRLKQKWNSEGTFFREGLLSEKNLPFYKLYLRDKVDAHTRIVSIIQKLIKGIGDYGEEFFEA